MLYRYTEINFYKIVTQHICRERSHSHPSDYIANNKNNWLLLMSQLNLEDLCEEYAPRAFAFLSKFKIWWNAGIPQGHLHFYPNLKFGEMLAYFKPFRRRSSGNTAQRLCVRCEVRFFVRLYKIDAGILAYVKEILCKITENLQADDVQSFQAVFVRCCLQYLDKQKIQDLVGGSI